MAMGSEEDEIRSSQYWWCSTQYKRKEHLLTEADSTYFPVLIVGLTLLPGHLGFVWKHIQFT
ncbi:hypothetical protein C5167_000311 [Papaver somniferum]|uniref:Uncharacterized protein n=1 Tax=Papaver somniferum TaxID=3469 RepID=A0A4Y7KVL6_PAPSO|nr:hypothetical protein C5167_000311 [Papaver somniferum]